MKRVDLVRHLETHGCEFLREGGRHTIYVNRATQRSTSIPRHREINNLLARSKDMSRFTSTRAKRNLTNRCSGWTKQVILESKTIYRR
jgi:mRNA interferase HicA